MTAARLWTVLPVLHLLSVQPIAGNDWSRPYSNHYPNKDEWLRLRHRQFNGYDPDVSRTTPVPQFTENPPYANHYPDKVEWYRNHPEQVNGYDPDLSRTTQARPFPVNSPAPRLVVCPPVRPCDDPPLPSIKMNFSRIGLKTVGNDFIDNVQMIELQLNDNSIVEVSPTAFRSVPKLHRLDLSGNNITTGKLLWFNNVDHLNTLVIDGNKYRNEADADLGNVLDSMPYLRVLSLQRNGIKRFAVNLKTFAPMLTHLYVSGNRIESLDFLDNATDTLSLLHVDDNSIAGVNGDHLATIKELSVSGNGIEKLCGESCGGDSLALGKATRLLRLNASRNEIGQVAEDAFASAKYLSSLDLSSNKIEKLPSGLFEGLTAVEELLMSRNQLTSVPNVCPLARMKRLDLSGNNIVAIVKGNFCSQLVYLETLLLANNHITNIDGDAFEGLQSLQKLDLSSNLIIDFPARLMMVSYSLQTLLLRNNSIAKLKGLNAVESNSLQELHLQENPLLRFEVAWVRSDSLPQLVIHLKDWPPHVETDTKADADDNDDNEDNEDNEV